MDDQENKRAEHEEAKERQIHIEEWQLDRALQKEVAVRYAAALRIDAEPGDLLGLARSWDSPASVLPTDRQTFEQAAAEFIAAQRLNATHESLTCCFVIFQTAQKTAPTLPNRFREHGARFHQEARGRRFPIPSDS